MSEDTTHHFVHITDTTDRNAEQKIRGAYHKWIDKCSLTGSTIDFASAHSTLDIGVLVSELVTNTERPDNLVLAVNCAGPDKEEGTKDNARNKFYAAVLKDGTLIIGTNNGYEFSFIKPLIKEFYCLENTNHKGSQFRSLEILPEHAVKSADKTLYRRLIQDKNFAPENLNAIADLPSISFVREVDNFGNVKFETTPVVLDQLQQGKGQKIIFAFGAASIELAGTTMPKGGLHLVEATVADTLFAAPIETNVLALNSSSRRVNDEPVPMLATIRRNPGLTRPNYRIPAIGAPIALFTGEPTPSQRLQLYAQKLQRKLAALRAA